MNLSIVERRVGKALAEDFVALVVGKARPARELLKFSWRGEIRKGVKVIVALLHLHAAEVNASLVDAYRRTRFHARLPDAVARHRFRELARRRFRHASARNLHGTEMEKAVQEGAGSKDDAMGVKDDAKLRPHPRYLLGSRGIDIFDKQLRRHVLPDVEIVYAVKNLSPRPDVFPSVALSPRAPHGRTFALVEHAELDGCAVGNDAHVTAKGGTLQNAILIPQRALVEMLYKKLVFVLDEDKKVTMREVKLGQNVGRLVVVTDGLHAGEQVVVEGTGKIRNGMAVNSLPIEEKDLDTTVAQ